MNKEDIFKNVFVGFLGLSVGVGIANIVTFFKTKKLLKEASDMFKESNDLSDEVIEMLHDLNAVLGEGGETDE